MSRADWLIWALVIALILLGVQICSAETSNEPTNELTVAGNATQDRVNSHAYMLRVEGDVGSWDYQAERAYSQTGEIITSDKYLVGIGVDYDINDKWRVWANEVYKQNIIPEYENLIGGGPKYCFIETDRWRVSTSTGIMHRWTEQDDRENTSTVLSTRGKVKYVRGDLTTKLLLSHIEDLEGAGYVTTGRLSAAYKLKPDLDAKAMVTVEQRPEGTVTTQFIGGVWTW